MSYDLHCSATGRHNAAASTLEHDLGLPSYVSWATVTQIWCLDKQPADGKTTALVIKKVRVYSRAILSDQDLATQTQVAPNSMFPHGSSCVML